MFLGQTANEEDADITAAIQSFEDRAVKLAEVAKFKDQLLDDNKDKPIKLIFMAVGIGWAIYHFLIKR